MGKLSDKELKTLLSCVKKDERVIIPPMAGYDSGVHMLDGKCVVVSTDPCTGVPEEWFGWLLINYAASDVALFGAKPEFCTINLLGPVKTDAQEFQKVMKQACRAADELGIAIVGGHTGTYSSLCGLLGVCTAYGAVEPEKLVTPAKAQAGDYILCTKSLGLEILVNFAITHKDLALQLFGKQRTEDLITQVHLQSCVNEALLLAKFSGVHAMHDATEEGIVTALNELADASNLGFKVQNEKMPITTEMQALQKHFSLSDLQVLSASSTGTILAAVNPKDKDEVKQKLLEKGVAASYVGYFTKDKKSVLKKNGRDLAFPRVADDPYAMILSGKPQMPKVTS
jgi:hydrogenase maturation factor